MWKFLKQVLAVFVALFLFTLFIIFVLLGIGSAASSTQNIAIVSDNSVLSINLDKPILEREIDNPFDDLNIPLVSEKSSLGLIQLKKAIAYAKTDDKIKGIYISVSSVQAGYATIEELRSALLDFKKSKKFIYAYSEMYSEGAYYLASVADRVFLVPGGLLEFNGLSSDHLFFKGMLEKLEIKPEVFRVGDYKSAVEPFMFDKMSDYNKKQTASYVNSLNNHMLGKISETRNIPLQRLKVISDSMLVHNHEDALELKIITDAGYYDQFVSAIRTELGQESESKVNFVSYGKYKSTVKDPENKSENKIAVIVAQGDINTGKSNEESIGSDDMAEEIRNARLDSSIKAVVLRINSPGGSALASDIMWREVMLTAKVKPVVASMSDVAASGGYYLAMGCDKIVAQPNSITGSIGVFGLMFNFKNFLEHKLGITSDGVKTGLFSDLGRRQRDLTLYERKVIQQEVEGIYKEFVTKAAEGRKMTVDSLKKLASGRVWSGLEAKNNGLVDALGGLDEAVKLAAKTAKLGKDYKLIYQPSEKSFVERFFSNLEGNARMNALKSELGPNYKYVKHLMLLEKLQGIQARLPFEMAIE